VFRGGPLARLTPTDFDVHLIEMADDAAQALGFSRRRMVSGAGDDSLHTAQFAPTAMIFISCAGGLSHNEEESASPEDLAAGADVLLQVAVKALMSERQPGKSRSHSSGRLHHGPGRSHREARSRCFP